MYDLEEQEKVDALKAWWKENQRRVLAFVVVAAIAYAAVTGWKSWKQHQAEQAAEAFAAFQKVVAQADASKVLAAALGIEQSSPASPYAARAALTSAQMLLGLGKTAEAQSQFEWVINHSEEVALQSLAHIRLAGLLADQKKFSEALALLDKGIDAAFAGMAADLRGDILLAQDKTTEARDAYRAALAAFEGNHPLRQVVQLKADALGGGNEPSKTSSAGSKP
jgi:predicted negative regulator of RcsB-dependent stress response